MIQVVADAQKRSPVPLCPLPFIAVYSTYTLRCLEYPSGFLVSDKKADRTLF